jgi:choline dehydrogenase-like flavoprotein
MAKGSTVQDKGSLEFANLLYNFLFLDEDKPYASPSELLSQFLIFSCMGMDNADGSISLRNNWQRMEESNDDGEKLSVQWSPEKNKEAFEAIIEGLKELAEEIEYRGSSQVTTPTWNQQSPSDSSVCLLHPLGTCQMGETIDEGVVNGYCEVFLPVGQDKKAVYPGFYVIDSSVFPSSVGVNSSLATAAVAFRAVERIVGDRRYWPA